VAAVEVQGYVYAAYARLAAAIADPRWSAELRAKADRIRAQIEDRFWLEEAGTYAQALDGAKGVVAVASSNAGHLLACGVPSPERASRLARRFAETDFASGWGIRTLSSTVPSFNPMSYHNGSVWPHDNSLIAAGFARYGHKNAVERIFNGLFAAATYMDLRRLPELYCGFQRGRERGPTLYPVACSPQAWAAGTPLLLLQSSLGLEFDRDRNEILLRKPQLPSFLQEVTLRNLRLGASSVDLMLRRQGEQVSLQVLRNEGQIRVAALYT
jgi:glycogen debranching enzyme